MLYVAVGWCGAKSAFINFRKMDFLLKKSFLLTLRGCGHIMLCFPVKSEIAQNFRVHSAGLVSVICRKVVAPQNTSTKANFNGTKTLSSEEKAQRGKGAHGPPLSLRGSCRGP